MLSRSSYSHKQAEARASRLTFLLDKSTIYAKIIGDRMARQQIEKRKAEQRAETRKANKEKKAAGEVAASRAGLRDKTAVVKEETDDIAGVKRKRKGEATGTGKRAKVDDEVRDSIYS